MNCEMGDESMIFVLEGKWWIAGTVYLTGTPKGDSGGGNPLGTVSS